MLKSNNVDSKLHEHGRGCYGLLAIDDGEYDGYCTWKDWSEESFACYSSRDAEYFLGELSGLSLSGGKVLELGFGNGNFLGFARDSGADVSGTELNTEAVRRAQAVGLHVWNNDLSDTVNEAAGQFDLIVAFDVLEHLTRDEVVLMFERLEILLRPGGVVVARFPNAQSPLGCVTQNGDLTHRSALSAPVLMQLLRGRPWRLVKAGNPYRVNTFKNPLRRFAQALRYRLRDAVEMGLNRLYGLEIWLDPNVSVRLERIETRRDNDQTGRSNSSAP